MCITNTQLECMNVMVTHITLVLFTSDQHEFINITSNIDLSKWFFLAHFIGWNIEKIFETFQIHHIP